MENKTEIQHAISQLEWLKFCIVGEQEPKKNTFEYASKLYLENAIQILKSLESFAKRDEVLKIIFEAPSILQQLFELGQLGKEATQRYMWGTITDSRVQKIKEFFADGKRDQSK